MTSNIYYVSDGWPPKARFSVQRSSDDVEPLQLVTIPNTASSGTAASVVVYEQRNDHGERFHGLYFVLFDRFEQSARVFVGSFAYIEGAVEICE